MTAWWAGLAARLPFHGVKHVNPNPYLIETRATITAIREYLVHVEARLAALEALEPVAAPIPSTDEYIAQAVSATAIYKAMEPDLGPRRPTGKIDRRTIVTLVERLVAVHRLNERFPGGATNLKLAQYVSVRMPDGRFRLEHALEALA